MTDEDEQEADARKARRARRRRAREKEFDEFVGRVLLETVSKGSKSERKAVRVDLGDRKLTLRRPGIRSFRDDKLESLVGKVVKFQGLQRGSRLLTRDWEVEKDDE